MRTLSTGRPNSAANSALNKAELKVTLTGKFKKTSTACEPVMVSGGCCVGAGAVGAIRACGGRVVGAVGVGAVGVGVGAVGVGAVGAFDGVDAG